MSSEMDKITMRKGYNIEKEENPFYVHIHSQKGSETEYEEYFWQDSRESMNIFIQIVTCLFIKLSGYAQESEGIFTRE